MPSKRWLNFLLSRSSLETDLKDLSRILLGIRVLSWTHILERSHILRETFIATSLFVFLCEVIMMMVDENLLFLLDTHSSAKCLIFVVRSSWQVYSLSILSCLLSQNTKDLILVCLLIRFILFSFFFSSRTKDSSFGRWSKKMKFSHKFSSHERRYTHDRLEQIRKSRRENETRRENE